MGGLALAPAIKTHAGSVTEQNKQLVDFTLAPAIKTHNVGLVAFMVFAFFSYPLSMIPLYTLIIFWLAVAASNTGKAYSIQLPAVLHYSLAAATLPLFAFLLHTNLQSLGAHKQWKTAHSLLQSGIYTKAATEYQKLNNILGHEPQFAHQYGKALVLGKQTTAGISILEQAKTICADPYLYCTLGNAYKAEGEYKKAATAYQYAANIIPHKFYAEYLLAKLYNDSGQTPLAIQTAKALLAKKVKVPSPAITDIKEAMREIIKTTIP